MDKLQKLIDAVEEAERIIKTLQEKFRDEFK